MIKLLTISAIVAAVILGIIDGDCTATVVFIMLFLPSVFEKRKKLSVRSKRRNG